jgi:hypothetical protein
MKMSILLPSVGGIIVTDMYTTRIDQRPIYPIYPFRSLSHSLALSFSLLLSLVLSLSLSLSAVGLPLKKFICLSISNGNWHQLLQHRRWSLRADRVTIFISSGGGEGEREREREREGERERESRGVCCAWCGAYSENPIGPKVIRLIVETKYILAIWQPCLAAGCFGGISTWLLSLSLSLSL